MTMTTRIITLFVGLPACTYPGTGVGGNISVVKHLYVVGETIEYSCVDGYDLVGERELRCLGPMKWSHPVPDCVSKTGNAGMSQYNGVVVKNDRNESI